MNEKNYVGFQVRVGASIIDTILMYTISTVFNG